MQNLKRRYDRFFIMFKPEQSGYSMNNQEIKGYMKIEIRDGKGKIITYIQGLKILKNDEMYRIYLISSQNNNCIGLPIGWLEIDNRGHGESRFEFNPDNVENSGLSIEDFNIGAILVKSKNSSQLIAPVVGYKGKETLWKNNFKEFSSAAPEITKEKYHQKDENNISTNLTDDNIVPATTNLNSINKIPNIAENTAENNHHSDDCSKETFISPSDIIIPAEIPKNIDHIAENLLPKDNINPIDEEVCNQKDDTDTPHQLFNKMVNKFYTEMEELQKYKILSEEDKERLTLKNKEPEIISDLQYMFTHNSKTKPFKNTYNDVTWIMIQPYELSALPISLGKYIHSCFINYSCKKYKYLILGQYNNAPNSYLLGVKDIYNSQNASITSLLGFEKFVNCESKELCEGDEGYWILEILQP